MRKQFTPHQERIIAMNLVMFSIPIFALLIAGLFFGIENSFKIMFGICAVFFMFKNVKLGKPQKNNYVPIVHKKEYNFIDDRKTEQTQEEFIPTIGYLPIKITEAELNTKFSSFKHCYTASERRQVVQELKDDSSDYSEVTYVQFYELDAKYRR